nr:FCD domain-containing protein [Paracoccus lichenicola]
MPHMLLDLFEALAEIEALCACLATQRVLMADLPAFEEDVQRMADADPAAYPAMNFDFHDRVCRLARNAELAGIADGLRQRLAPCAACNWRAPTGSSGPFANTAP